jgi:hypothetical protein
VLIALYFLAATAASDGLETKLETCRSIADADERVACYDAIVDALADDGLDHAADTPKAAVVAPVTEENFGRSAEAIRREQLEKAGVESMEELSATITDVRSIGRYRVEVTLDNGQRWRQASGSGLGLDVGDEITIRPAALGSFRLSPAGSKRSMKVRRVD